ncbi:Peptidase S1, PA clan,Serine proteases, trypsin domain,Sushi/SCR/CCP domain [Cinara cedri]|uniref:Peptidase S1, PA clan,Serine proteases, trypsin domain,Sushi/SCR/CCP domain n=1 Tax=Cinara cedri TaxID=506608 RepID=A0A5E4LZB7_9HEMI|nr:Peptidase S1, PA clan,Serine proteases, trypsin domain,Sushi/SCR/CCP domain [Cinara cedri]
MFRVFFVVTAIMFFASVNYADKEINTVPVRTQRQIYDQKEVSCRYFKKNVQVQLIYLEDNYQHSDRYYANDIAIIVLKNNVIMSEAVMPVCIDWAKKYTIPNGSIGKIAGWGMIDKQVPSPVLLELLLPYTDRNTCHNLNTTKTVLRNYVTSDKFCGLKGPGFRGGEGGFGGAGLTFAHQDDSYFLAGIVSITFNKTVEILTDVSKHIPWIHTIYSKYNGNDTKYDEEKKYGSIPWNVGIYRKYSSNKYFMMCGGTLISSNLVVTAAQFFWQNDLKSKIITEIEYYKIAVGKYTREFSEIDNESTQIHDVQLIYLEDNYQHSDRYYANDIAIIVLKNNVIMSEAVMPVCIDWAKKYTIPNGSIGKIAGWGMIDKQVPSPVLLELLLPYTDRNTCHNLNTTKTVLRNYVTSDKFCGLKGPGFRGGEGGFGGAGLTFEHEDGLYFLTGIVSITFNKTVEILTDVSKHIPWIRNIYSEYNVNESTSNSLRITTSSPVPTELSTQVGCTIPVTDGSKYSIANRDLNRNTFLHPGTQVPLNSKVEETCDKGYYKIETFNKKQIKCEENGEWFPPLNESAPLCMKKCSPMISDSLDLKCIYNGREVNCEHPAINGTVLKPKCKATHSLRGGQIETPMVSICLSNGDWSQQLYSCVLNCGQRFAVQPIPLIQKGFISKIGSVPWNAGVYEKKKDNYELLCGGTLISQNLIISAATCFSRTGSEHYIPVENNLYKIAVAKYTRNITIKDNQFTQIIDVKSIYLEDYYFGTSGYYANDIAILVLTNDVSTSHFVLPACIDWTAINPIPDKSNGLIVGWGKTETTENSVQLMEAALPYIDHTKCRNLYNKINPKFKSFLTSDKFCAGSESGQGANRGDAGFGLTFEHGGSHYVTGISTIKDESKNSYSVFTNIGYHIKWIQSIFDKNDNIQ